MHWRLFLLLSLPSLLCASLHRSDCSRVLLEHNAEIERYAEIAQQFSSLASHEKEQKVGFLIQAIDSCQQAMGHLDTILAKIAKMSSKHRHSKTWVKIKNDCERQKSILNNKIIELQCSVNNTSIEAVFSRAMHLYQESEKRANLASDKLHNCTHSFTHIDEVIPAFSEAGILYEEALALGYEALSLISPYPNETIKSALIQAIETYQQAIVEYKQGAAEWPAAALAHVISTLKEQLEDLKEERRLLDEEQLRWSSYKVQKLTLPILKMLAENSSGQESASFQEELSELNDSIATFETAPENN